jgi:hypothetical protein
MQKKNRLHEDMLFEATESLDFVLGIEDSVACPLPTKKLKLQSNSAFKPTEFQEVSKIEHDFFGNDEDHDFLSLAFNLKKKIGKVYFSF